MTSNMWMTGHRVELPEMLAGRERRAYHQRELRQRYPGTLVCFTLNIAGPYKVFALSEEMFRRTMNRITGSLTGAGMTVTHTECDCIPCGWEGYASVEEDAAEVKRILLTLEETDPAGRLFDIDVLRPDGTKVSREEFGLPPRACLICGKPTIGCARSRAHTVEQLQNRTVKIFLEDLCIRRKTTGDGRMHPGAEFLAALCRQAMLLEVYTTPKPGLVDRNNSGAHRDMDVLLFECSTAALEDYFRRCAAAGQQAAEAGTEPEEILAVIRPYGIEAEKKMFAATGGVNTHKGMIFSLGILVCSAAFELAAVPMNYDAEQSCTASDHRQTESEDEEPDCSDRKNTAISAVLRTAGRIAAPAWEGDLKNLREQDDLTAGERQYLAYGVGGIRREAAEGFPSVRDLSLPAFLRVIRNGEDWESAGREALLVLIASVTDTNIISRVGRDAAEELKDSVRRVIEAYTGADGCCTVPREEIEELDRLFTEKNASPGGCADLLALTYFLYEIRELL